MKGRAKSTRGPQPAQTKQRKVSEESKHPKCPKKLEDITDKNNIVLARSNLVKTLTLFEKQFNIPKVDAKENIASLSNNVYNCVKKYIVLSNSYTDVSLAQQGSQEIGPQHSAVNQSVCSMVNLNSDSHTGSRPGKRRSNSNLDEYFREKFGSPAKDEESVQRKLRVLKALKKSQQIVSKNFNSSSTGSTAVGRGFQNSWIQSVCNLNDNNIVLDKIKSRKGK